jgi:phosphohistidine phosphatase
VIDVYLVRHAIAEQRDWNRWPDDADRPLSPVGVERFRGAARGLRELVPKVDAVYTSPYVRAVQTAEVLEQEAGWPAAQLSPPLAGNRPAADAVPLLRTVAAESSVALVGHEPYLSSLASLLAAGDEGALRLELKKGGVVVLSCPATPAPRAAVMRWSVSPKILRRLDAARARKGRLGVGPTDL